MLCGIIENGEIDQRYEAEFLSLVLKDKGVDRGISFFVSISITTLTVNLCQSRRIICYNFSFLTFKTRTLFGTQ